MTATDNVAHEITICVCTFHRPDSLNTLLQGLAEQFNGEKLISNLVVVDNDAGGSARPIIEKARPFLAFPILYCVEPRKSISLARNRAVSCATGDLVALIDDDECPDQRWLDSLVRCLDEYSVDGVLGPVKPRFLVSPPSWVVRGRLCERPTYKSGTAVGPREMRTGNALLRSRLFQESKEPFDPKWGHTGGEDVDFFARMVALGKKFVWCDEAIVFESIPPERLRRSYFLRRALLRGFGNSMKTRLISAGSGKSLLACLAYTISLPGALLLGQHAFMKLLIKDCDHIGKLLGLLGIKPVKERP